LGSFATYAGPARIRRINPLETIMLYTIALILLVLWVLGLATSFTAGGLLHLLLVLALIVVLYQFITGRRAG
jgi:hypothetical protein